MKNLDEIEKEVREKSMECQNHKPQPLQTSRGKGKKAQIEQMYELG